MCMFRNRFIFKLCSELLWNYFTKLQCSCKVNKISILVETGVYETFSVERFYCILYLFHFCSCRGRTTVIIYFWAHLPSPSESEYWFYISSLVKHFWLGLFWGVNHFNLLSWFIFILFFPSPFYLWCTSTELETIGLFVLLLLLSLERLNNWNRF